MSNETKQSSSNALVAIAGACGGASVGIVAVAFVLLRNISDSGMWAIAAMTAAPCAMGVGIAFFITTHPLQESGSNKPQTQP